MKHLITIEHLLSEYFSNTLIVEYSITRIELLQNYWNYCNYWKILKQKKKKKEQICTNNEDTKYHTMNVKYYRIIKRKRQAINNLSSTKPSISSRSVPTWRIDRSIARDDRLYPRRTLFPPTQHRNDKNSRAERLPEMIATIAKHPFNETRWWTEEKHEERRRGERGESLPGLLHFHRGIRDAFHILFLRAGAQPRDRIWRGNPRAGGFTFEIKTFSPGKCCATCRCMRR